MEDFFFYFIAGMIGEELMHKLATRPYGFWLLWLIGVGVMNLLIFLFFIVMVVISAFKTGGDDGSGQPFSILNFAHDFLHFFFITTQPWLLLFSLAMGFLLAMAYRDAYKRRVKEERILMDK